MFQYILCFTFFLVTYIQLCIRIEFYYIKLQVLFCFHSSSADCRIWLTLPATSWTTRSLKFHDRSAKCLFNTLLNIKDGSVLASLSILDVSQSSENAFECVRVSFMIINLMTVHAMIVIRVIWNHWKLSTQIANVTSYKESKAIILKNCLIVVSESCSCNS